MKFSLSTATFLCPSTSQIVVIAILIFGVIGQTVTTLAGNGTAGFANGVGTNAMFNSPVGVALSPSGSSVYVADDFNSDIRDVKFLTGVVTTLAGNNTPGYVDGVGTNAKFRGPIGIAVSSSGLSLFVADIDGSTIRAIIISNGVVTTLAGHNSAGFVDGVGTNARFYTPSGVAISPSGMVLYVTDFGNNAIRIVTTSKGAVETLAGNGTAGFVDGVGTNALFNHPSSVTVHPNGMRMFVADFSNSAIRAITISTGAVTTFAGNGLNGFSDGVGSNAMFDQPMGIAAHPSGLTLFVGDSGNSAIRTITISTGVVTTLAGNGTSGFTDGVGTNARFYSPSGVAVSPSGLTVVVADAGGRGSAIRAIAIST